MVNPSRASAMAGGEQGLPRQLAVFRVSLGGEAEVARHPDAAPAGDRLRHAQRLAVDEEPFGIGGERCGLAPVDGRHCARGVAQHEEPAAADARAFGLDHGQRQHRRDRRVGRAAALAQHRRSGLGGARIGGADDPARAGQRRIELADRGGSPWSRRGDDRAGGERERPERDEQRSYQAGKHRGRGYALPTAWAIAEKPSRRMSLSKPRLIARGRPGPA